MNPQKNHFLSCVDYTVSQKIFDLVYCKEMEMLETYPKPNTKELGGYYLSDEYISHTDANKSFIDKVYQTIKKIALGNKLRLLNSLNTDSKMLLDIGCGTGAFLQVCEKNGWNVSGVEPNELARKLAGSKLKNKNTTNLVQDIAMLGEQKFDVISLWHVLEHIPNLDEFTAQLKKLLKPNGLLIVAVPNFKSYDANYYKQFWAAYDVPRHLWHFSKKSIQLLFSKREIIVQKTLPMKFDSFYVSLLSEKHKTGNGNMIKAFFIGLLSNIKAKRTGEYSSLIYILKNSKNKF